ncbi:hypothetical protein SLEP1_g36284 [Rubroshorea leprosula]|uniref:Endonuclease/exonuclease/phosphatase domain-containing protein n=1 Tax=Rubroshorea leprosula TaxID=152421 RepID=A0AAV5KQZ3_9ROSI|nr:hypothetical protein SLEP1_g36284 [Rubroshorea leprosula]
MPRFGVPLALDKATEERTCVNYAKLCVEIEVAAAQDLLENIVVDIEGCPSVDVNDVPNVESALPACHEVLPVQKENQPVKPLLQNETLLTAQGQTTVSLMEQGPIEKQNSFEALASINDEQAFPPLQVSSVSPKSLKKPRQASLGVATVTKALAPRQRNCKKISNPSSEKQNFDKIAGYLLPEWSRFCNYDSTPLGRIWLFWKSHVTIRISSSNHQAIHCHVVDNITKRYMFASFVYADNSPDQRRQLWDELVALSRVLPKVPWIIGGDFNEVRYLQKRSDWIQNMHFSKDSMLFNDRLNEAELSDLPACGPKFTWSNKRIEGLIVKKLDRLLVNSTWFSTFPRTRAEFLPPDISDHCAGSVTIMEVATQNTRKPFKIFNFWTKNERFLNIVQEVWSSVTVSGCYMFQLCKKLKALKAPLRELNKDCYSDLQGRIQQETSKLHAIQIDLLANPHEDLVLVE